MGQQRDLRSWGRTVEDQDGRTAASRQPAGAGTCHGRRGLQHPSCSTPGMS